VTERRPRVAEVGRDPPAAGGPPPNDTIAPSGAEGGTPSSRAAPKVRGPQSPRRLARPFGRAVLVAALALSAVVPFALLALWSVSRQWFYPALLPPELTGESWRAVVGGGAALSRAAVASLVLAALTGALGCALALPVGRALDRLGGWRRHLGAAAAFLPVAAPPVAVGTGLQFFLLTLGLGGTALGVLLAHLVPAVGYLSLYFLGVFSAFDARVEEEARTLGATPLQVLRAVTVPMLRRQIAEAFALGFLISWAQVALTLLVGGGAVRTLPLEVFAYVRSGQDRFAATGALLLAVPPLVALAAVRLAARRTEVVPA
jgi:putative spermidine/putrescine transport system permease protein